VTIVLEQRPQKWDCPNCTVYAVTFGQTNRFHRCSGLSGLLVAMVPAGTRCKIEAVERQDWIGTEDVPRDGNGRPVMAAVTTRDDGNDVTVYAPTAHVKAG
jgi:hypothetical protein